MTTFTASEIAQAANSKTALKEVGAKDIREGMWNVPFEKLVVLPGLNVREHDAKWTERVRALANDMKAHGYLKSKPLEVFVDEQGQIIVTDGHTRHAAITLAREEGAENLHIFPTIPRDKGTTLEDITVDLVRSNSGEKLSALGLSVVVKRLIEVFGKTAAQAAEKLGMSPKYANQLILLGNAPERLKEMIIAGVISATLVIETIEEFGNETALEMLEAGLKEATSKGKKKVSQKHVLTPEQKLDKAQKEQAATLFQLITLLMDEGTEKSIPKDLHDRIEDVLCTVETARDMP